MSDQNERDKQITAAIIKDIEEHRLHIAYIESDGYSPGFGYSIGLYKEFGHPELIVVGLQVEATGAIINNAKNEIEKRVKFIEGINYHDFLIDFVEVHKEYYRDYLGYAGWYNDNSMNFPTLQIVWPDKAGNFPWEPGFDQQFKFVQP